MKELKHTIFPDMDFTEYHEDIRKKHVKEKSLREFIYFDRDGFLLLYPAPEALLSLSMLSLALLTSGVISYIFYGVCILFGFKFYKKLHQIKSLPKDTVYYDIMFREYE